MRHGPSGTIRCGGSVADSPEQLRMILAQIRTSMERRALSADDIAPSVGTVVDAREQNAPKLNSGNLVFDGLSMQLRSLVASVVTTNGLNPNVGLCDLDFTQTMDEAPFTVGTHGLRLIRGATELPQKEQLTKWVTEVFSK
jgi:hypothetical protein